MPIQRKTSSVLKEREREREGARDVDVNHGRDPSLSEWGRDVRQGSAHPTLSLTPRSNASSPSILPPRTPVFEPLYSSDSSPPCFPEEAPTLLHRPQRQGGGAALPVDGLHVALDVALHRQWKGEAAKSPETLHAPQLRSLACTFALFGGLLVVALGFVSYVHDDPEADELPDLQPEYVDMAQTEAIRAHAAALHSTLSSTQHPLHHQKLPTWSPRVGRYLLAPCSVTVSKLSLLCLKHALVLASLLNRTLVLPQSDPCGSPSPPRYTPLHLHTHTVPEPPPLDLAHLEECLHQGILGTGGALSGLPQVVTPFSSLSGHMKLAQHGVVTLDQVLEVLHLSSLTVDMLLCKAQNCPPEHCTVGNLLRYPTPTQPPVEAHDPREPMSREDVAALGVAAEDAGVVSLGNILSCSVDHHRVPKGPRALAHMFGSECAALLRAEGEVFQLAAQVP